ncbi:hypothetical protein EMCRGX_G022408 [Ephydatia muelleri]
MTVRIRVPEVIVSSAFSWRNANVHVISVEKKTMRVELQIGTHIREADIEMKEFKALYKQCTKNMKDCPPLPKKGSKQSLNAQILQDCFQKLLRLDCTPQALLELFHQQIDELLDNTPLVQDHIGPNITSEPSKQTMNFSFPLIKINSSDKTDVMDIFTNGFLFSTHPQQWLQSSTFANDVVIHGVFGALGYIDITK